MKISKGYLLLIFISILLLMSGCNDEPLAVLSEEKLDKEIAYWSSEKFKGRQTGTQGNISARNEIAKQFNEIDLEPLSSKGYLMPFFMSFNDPKEIQTKLVVHLKDGQVKEFSYGKDWMHKISSGINVELPIQFVDGVKEISEESKQNILVTEKMITPIEDVRAQFVKTDTFKKTIFNYGAEGSVFQISESLYTYLQTNEKEVDKVKLVYHNAPFKQITAHNVVGKIPGDGKNVGKQAIVISAHFDHVGTAGELTFKGSVDNATGLTGLMNLASILKEDSKEKPFSSDIIIAAFNAEESNLIGSSALVEAISPDYESIININMDTIGIKDGGKITFAGETIGSSLLSKELENIALSQETESTLVLEEFATLQSDHVSFLRANYQAINISQERYDKIHSIEDTPANSDSKPLKSAIEVVQAFVKTNHDTKFETIDQATPTTSPQGKTERYKEMTIEEISTIQSTFKDQSFKLVEAAQLYKLINPESISSNSEVGDSDYEFSSTHLVIQKGNKKYFIQIFSSDGISFEEGRKNIETLGSWQFFADEEKLYNVAISTITLDNQQFSLIAQNFNQKTEKSYDSYTKEEIEGLIVAFDEELVIKALLKMQANQ